MPSNNADRIRELNEQYEDGLFRLVMNDVAEKEGKLLFEENERLRSDPENLPSQKDIDRFTKLLDSHLWKAKKLKKLSHIENIHQGSRCNFGFSSDLFYHDVDRPGIPYPSFEFFDKY